MKKDKVVKQLEYLKKNRQDFCDMYDLNGADEIIALEYAISKVKKDKSYMGSYYQGVWHMFLLILLVKVTDTLFTMFWG